jgi:hypothetical protein
MSETQHCFTEPTFTPGSFTLERNSATGTIEVRFRISGGPTDLNADTSAGDIHTVTFSDGNTQVTVTVHPAFGGSEATVNILAPVDRGTYQLGDPSTATIPKSVAYVQCASPSTPTTKPQTLARAGFTSLTLVLIGLGMIVAGMALKRTSKRPRITTVNTK